MDKINEHSQEQPTANLHHYTTIRGFMGIVESRQMWATDLQYMNDTKELLYAGDIVNEVILENCKTHENYEELGKIFKSGIYNSKYASVFGISFSEARDLLSQWRGYGGEAGMAICFESGKLQTFAAANEMRLVKCVYDRDVQIKLVSELCDFHANEITRMKKEEGKFDPRAVAEDFYRALCSVAPIIKHPTFHDENEWRMISRVYDVVYRMDMPYPRMGFRDGKTTIIPYLKTTLAVDYQDARRDGRIDLGFHDVLIGPTAIAELPWRAVMNYLGAKNIKYSQISPSGVPLRGSV